MTTPFYLSPHSGLRYMDRLVVACPHTWPAAKGCHAWGAVGPHGCKFLPGHEGRHVCACGRRETSYPSVTDEPCDRCGGRGVVSATGRGSDGYEPCPACVARQEEP